MRILLLLLCVLVSKSIDTINSNAINDTTIINDVRELAALDRHVELIDRYNNGDRYVVRRKLTRSPTKKRKSPTKRPTYRPTKITTRPTKRPTRARSSSPIVAPSRAPTTSPTAHNTIIPVGTIFRDDTTVYVINSATQFTTYTADGVCTTLPYYELSGNIMVNAFTSLLLSKKEDNKITSIDLSNNSNNTFTILNSNPYADTCISTKSRNNTYININDIFKQGDVYYDGNEEFPWYWYTTTTTTSNIIILILLLL